MYFYLSEPYEVIVVNESAKIIDIDNKIRAFLQGKRFWRNQQDRIERELKRELNEPQRQKKDEEKIDQAMGKFKQSLEEYYSKNPEKKPSPTQLKADELRSEADQIERNEFKLLLERERHSRIADLNKHLLIVQEKIKE